MRYVTFLVLCYLFNVPEVYGIQQYKIIKKNTKTSKNFVNQHRTHLQRFYRKNYYKYLNADGYNAEGRISIYANKFQGKRTASGMRYMKNAYTAASIKLPLMSVLQVTNLNNNKKLYIVVNDRGPYTGGHMLDLSFGAAKELGLVKSKHRYVHVEFDLERTLRVLQGDKRIYQELKLSI